MGLFRFRQFSINDDHSAMKVGTDGVLLGAWCAVGNARRLLDIGTGSGLIALMLAQRSRPEAIIDAVEIHEADAIQAEENVRHSPWPSKVRIIHTRAQDFHPAERYDVIVCNPPFFSRSLLPPDAHRQQARHDVQLSHGDLAQAAARLLSPAGSFHVIMPPAEASQFMQVAAHEKLYLSRHTRFYSRERKPQERSLMSFTAVPAQVTEDELVLYQDGNVKTQAYLDLTGAFYL